MARLSAQTWDDLLQDALIIGSPETVANKISQLQAIGVGEVACWMNFGGIPPDKVRRSMRLFAQDIIPRFQVEPAQAVEVA
jgi:alkanesulfonate monooxygenase SsuD/methylene tetrahydromethanopterin reductase-like flavin-dependent oxidoreductase (luciferase family)